MPDGDDPGIGELGAIGFRKGERAFLIDVPLFQLDFFGKDEQVKTELEGGFAHFVAQRGTRLGGLFFAGGQ